MSTMNGADIARLLYTREPIVDPSNVTGSHYRSRHRTAFQKYFLGSSWYAALGTFIIMLIIDIVQLVVIDLVIEKEFPDIFPVDSFLISVFTGIILFGGPLFVTVEQSFQHTMLFDVLDLKGGTASLASEITTFVNFKRMRDLVPNSWIYTSSTTLERGDRTLYEVMYELNALLRVLPWVRTIDILRRRGQDDPQNDTDYPSNLDPAAVETLPLPQNLKYELESYRRADSYGDVPESAVSDQLYNMINARMSTLHWVSKRDQLTTDTFVASADRQMSALSSASARLQANLLASVTPIIKSFILVCIVVWGLLIPIVAWGSFRWFTIAVLFFTLYPALAIYYIGAKLEDQFRDYNDNNYVINDLKLIAQEAAGEVDAIFDHCYRMAGIEAVANWQNYNAFP